MTGKSNILRNKDPCLLLLLLLLLPPRFAKGKGQATIEGHKGGFNKLAECLQWCRRLGVEEVGRQEEEQE